MKIFETIKECHKNGRRLRICKSIEGIYFLYYGEFFIDNSFSLEDIEELFDLTMNGFKFDNFLKFKDPCDENKHLRIYKHL